MSERHEIPTHLNVADKAFGGLTMRQLLSAAIGLALAYGAASDLPVLMPGRLVVAAVVLIATLLLVLWRPAGRPLEDWVFVLLRYWAVPRVAVWRPRELSAPPGTTHEVVLRPLTETSDQPVTTKGGVHAITP
ncbi:MAG: PrgI family protein [Dehalococcoidia bacterium]